MGEIISKYLQVKYASNLNSFQNSLKHYNFKLTTLIHNIFPFSNIKIQKVLKQLKYIHMLPE